jgi:hypothetical protein
MKAITEHRKIEVVHQIGMFWLNNHETIPPEMILLLDELDQATCILHTRTDGVWDKEPPSGDNMQHILAKFTSLEHPIVCRSPIERHGWNICGGAVGGYPTSDMEWWTELPGGGE